MVVEGGSSEEGGQRRYGRRDECSPCSRSLCLETRAWINRKYSCTLLSLVPVTPSVIFFFSPSVAPSALHPIFPPKLRVHLNREVTRNENIFKKAGSTTGASSCNLSLQHLVVLWDVVGKRRGCKSGEGWGWGSVWQQAHWQLWQNTTSLKAPRPFCCGRLE